MHISKSRYITVCQQFLVTGVVLGVGLSAAGVMTLQIVAPEATPGLAPAVRVSEAFVDKRPVTPEVREVAVEGIDPDAARDIPGVVSEREDVEDPEAGEQEAPAKKLAALSEPTKVSGYATVGVTWKAGTTIPDDQIDVQVRTRTGETWSEWTTAEYHDDHGPDAGSVEAAKVRPGTDAVVIGDVDEVQMKAETTTGDAPADLALAVVDPGAGSTTREPAEIDTADLAPSSASPGAGDIPGDVDGVLSEQTGDADAAALMAMTTAPRPTIYSRAQWGANESLRDKGSLRYGTIKTGFIHHTVNANNYSASQVPALIRGIYAYHTQSRGWSDIGYNFLVDRFGKIWEGRYGGVTRAVVGAHTLGYNEYSFAMSAIGNFDVVRPPQVMLDSYASLFAWKLSLSNIRADATRLYVKNRYFQGINGHRDAGSTACPGRYLYAQLPAVRTAAQAIQNRAQAPANPAAQPIIAAPAGVPDPTQAPAPATTQPSFRFPARTNLIGSGWPDLVLKSSSGLVRLLSTEGIAGFLPRVVSSGPWTKMSGIVAVGDVTGDRAGDVLARRKSTGVTRVYRGDGAGHVSRTGTAPTKAFRRHDLLLGAGDFDRDGHNDVIARKRGVLKLFRGTGRGTFRTPVVLKKRWPYTLTAAVGRFDSDRRPDLVAMSSSGALYLFPGTGKHRKLAPRVRIGTLPSGVDALYGGGDRTGDRRADLLVRRAGLATIYAGNGAGRVLGQTYGRFPDLARLGRTSAGQLRGNATSEVVGIDASGRLAVVASDGHRNIGSNIPTNLSVPGASQVLTAGDWDRNGTTDLITRESNGDQLVLRPSLGGGKFGQGRSLGTGWASVRQLAPVGDVTGDGFPDLLGRISSTKPWTIFPGAGNNGFTAPVLAPDSLRTFNQIGTGAWSPDGWVFGSADRSFVPLVSRDVPSALRATNGESTASYDFYVGVGDANGDRVSDLLAREKGTGVIWLLPGKTSGGFAPRVWVAAGLAGYQLLG